MWDHPNKVWPFAETFSKVKEGQMLTQKPLSPMKLHYIHKAHLEFWSVFFSPFFSLYKYAFIFCMLVGVHRQTVLASGCLDGTGILYKLSFRIRRCGVYSKYVQHVSSKTTAISFVLQTLTAAYQMLILVVWPGPSSDRIRQGATYLHTSCFWAS